MTLAIQRYATQDDAEKGSSPVGAVIRSNLSDALHAAAYMLSGRDGFVRIIDQVNGDVVTQGDRVSKFATIAANLAKA